MRNARRLMLLLVFAGGLITDVTTVIGVGAFALVSGLVHLSLGPIRPSTRSEPGLPACAAPLAGQSV